MQCAFKQTLNVFLILFPSLSQIISFLMHIEKGFLKYIKSSDYDILACKLECRFCKNDIILTIVTFNIVGN